MKPFCSDDELLTTVNVLKNDPDLADGEKHMATILSSVAVDLRRIANAAENFNYQKVGEIAVASTRFAEEGEPG